MHYAREVFLPEGYPHTVSEDYLRYQFWDTIQALCSSVMGILATQGTECIGRQPRETLLNPIEHSDTKGCWSR